MYIQCCVFAGDSNDENTCTCLFAYNSKTLTIIYNKEISFIMIYK